MPEPVPPTPAGRWRADADGRRWWFDSGSVALDFAYTGSLDGSDAEQFHAPEDLAVWLRATMPIAIGPARSRDLFDAVSLREAIARLAVAASRRTGLAAADIDVVNLFAATPDVPPVLAGGTRQAGRSVHPVGQALSTIAREAVVLFGERAERIRACEGEDCGLVFHDTSRAGSRRWCSMQRCGNRAKVRAHRARRRPELAAS